MEFVRQVSHADLRVRDEYELTRDEGEHTYKSYEDEVPLREDERFTATYIGPTPVS